MSLYIENNKSLQSAIQGRYVSRNTAIISVHMLQMYYPPRRYEWHPTSAWQKCNGWVFSHFTYIYCANFVEENTCRHWGRKKERQTGF